MPLAPRSVSQILLEGSKFGKDPYAQASRDPEIIRAWWEKTPAANIAIAGGQGHLWIDRDPRNGGDDSLLELEIELGPLPDTFTQSTPGDGEHYAFSVPYDLASHNAFRPGIDIKCFHGFVAGLGSKRAKYPNKTYTIKHDLPVAPLPQSWIDALSRPIEKPTPNFELPKINEAAAIKDAIEYLATAPEAIEGAGGDAVTFQVAARLKDFGLSVDQTIELMYSPHWFDGCGWAIDELGVKVRNAYLYGQNPIGSARPEVIFEEIAESPAPHKHQLLHHTDREPDLQAVDLVDGFLSPNSLAAIVGPSNVGKTFLALDMAFAIAQGTPWLGRYDVLQGPAVYLALESSEEEIARRMKSYRSNYPNAQSAPLYYAARALDLSHSAASGWEFVLASIASLPAPPAIIVIDTVARALAGADENSAKDMGAFIKACDKLRERTKSCVLLIHHTGKDSDKGARGSSAFNAALDTQLDIKGHKSIVSVKQRAMAKPSTSIKYDLKSLVLGQNAKGKDVTGCVVIPGEISPGEAFGEGSDSRETAQEAANYLARGLWAVRETFARHMDGEDPMRDVKSVSEDEVWDVLRSSFYGDAPDNTWRPAKMRIKQALKDHGTRFLKGRIHRERSH